MKKKWKRTLAGGAARTLLMGALSIPALAAEAPKAGTLTPYTVNGVTYLPLESLEQFGLKLVWDEAQQAYVLAVATPSAGSNGNAANSNATSNPNTNVNTGATGSPAANGYIGEARAKEIALAHAGLSASQVSFYRTKLDYDHGRAEYEVEFWKDHTEYDYEIDAATGDILSFDYDIEGYSISAPQSSNDIGAEKAKTIALNHAGVNASDTVFLYAQLDYEHGRRVYEVEFFSGNKEFDYEIDAATGDILSYDFDAERYNIPSNSGDYISEAQAKQIVEQMAGTTGFYKDFKLDVDDGRVIYEGELRSGWMEYEFEIDAVTGAVLDWDMDYDD